jgi:hypothetical protein
MARFELEPSEAFERTHAAANLMPMFRKLRSRLSLIFIVIPLAHRPVAFSNQRPGIFVRQRFIPKDNVVKIHYVRHHL